MFMKHSLCRMEDKLGTAELPEPIGVPEPMGGAGAYGCAGAYGGASTSWKSVLR